MYVRMYVCTHIRYDEGIMLDRESWYSVTPEAIARRHAARLAGKKSKTKGNKRVAAKGLVDKVAIDGFCGAGGSAIQLACVCRKVIALDLDPEKVGALRFLSGCVSVWWLFFGIFGWNRCLNTCMERVFMCSLFPVPGRRVYSICIYAYMCIYICIYIYIYIYICFHV
jgi:hypothetical protein